MEHKKIAFTGTQNSGKTTLVNYIVQHDKKRNWNTIGSIARDCPLPINEMTSIEAQTWIMTTRIQREIRENNMFQNLLLERCVLDDYAYTQYMIKKENLFASREDVHLVDELSSMQWQMVKRWIKTYDKIFYLEPVPLKKDGVRPEGKQFQLDIDNIIKKNIEELGISVVKIKKASIKDRYKIFMKEMK